jgi:ABC-type amino acid transport substrate-binding protein
LRRIVARNYQEIGQALDALAEGKCDAVVYDAPLLRYEVHRQFDRSLFVLPSEFERQDYAFAMPPDSPIRENVNQALLRIKASPEWQDELARLLGGSSR